MNEGPIRDGLASAGGHRSSDDGARLHGVYFCRVARTRPPRRLGRWLLFVAFLLLVLLGGGVAAVALWPQAMLPRMAAWLDVGQPPQKADYAVPLPGGEEERARKVAELYAAGFVPRVLIMREEEPPPRRDGRKTGTQLEYEELVASGVPLDRIAVVFGKVQSTRTDGRMLREFLVSHPSVRLLVVTHHYHTRRARWTLDRVLGQHADRAIVVSVPSRRFSSDDWWKDRRGRELVLLEFMKLAYYYVVLSPWWIWATVAVLVAAGLFRGIRARSYSQPIL